jgi:hypothetical protein
MRNLLYIKIYMNNTSKRIFILILLIYFFLLPSRAYTEIVASPGGVAVFGVPNNNTADTALTAETVERLKKVFTDCGRFMPAGRELDTAYNKAKKDLRENENIFAKTSGMLNLDLYVLVSSYQQSNTIYSEINVVPIKPEYKNLGKKIKLKSRIKLNISLKSGIEIALLHKNIPVNATVLKDYSNSNYLINAGEWQGIKNNETYNSNGYTIQTIQTGRFESIVKISAWKKEGESVQILLFPAIDKIIGELEDDISRNTVSKYELDSAEKKLVEGICVLNMCSNFCIPGYGVSLSVSYLGFKDTKTDWPGVTLSTSIVAMQFLLPELMTDFKVNFLPWKKDSDKTGKMQDMHKFLWLTLPVTFSAAYMDQLAFQFNSTEHLPPFFKDKDNMAAVLSLFIPGGGIFYKGHRLAGWSFYFSEMLTAGYAVYNYNDNSGKYALYALGAIKLLDIVYAYLSSSSYSFYNLEKEREMEPVSLNMGFKTGPNNDRIYNLMVTSAF